MLLICIPFSTITHQEENTLYARCILDLHKTSVHKFEPNVSSKQIKKNRIY